MRHLMPEYGSEFIDVAAEASDKSPIDRHVVGRIACRIEDSAVRDCPCKGQRVHTEHIVTVLHEPLHNSVHKFDITRIPRTPVFRNILSLALHLSADIIAERKHRAERRVIRTEHAERLRRNAPRVNRLRACRRKECRRRNHENRKHCCRCFPHPSPHISIAYAV